MSMIYIISTATMLKRVGVVARLIAGRKPKLMSAMPALNKPAPKTKPKSISMGLKKTLASKIKG